MSTVSETNQTIAEGSTEPNYSELVRKIHIKSEDVKKAFDLHNFSDFEPRKSKFFIPEFKRWFVIRFLAKRQQKKKLMQLDDFLI